MFLMDIRKHNYKILLFHLRIYTKFVLRARVANIYFFVWTFKLKNWGQYIFENKNKSHWRKHTKIPQTWIKWPKKLYSAGRRQFVMWERWYRSYVSLQKWFLEMWLITGRCWWESLILCGSEGVRYREISSKIVVPWIAMSVFPPAWKKAGWTINQRSCDGVDLAWCC